MKPGYGAIERLLPPPADVLDIGTDTGFVALIASSLGHRVTGLDLSAAMLAEARMEAGRRSLDVTFRLDDAVAPAIAERSVGAIVCRNFIWTPSGTKDCAQQTGAAFCDRAGVLW